MLADLSARSWTPTGRRRPGLTSQLICLVTTYIRPYIPPTTTPSMELSPLTVITIFQLGVTDMKPGSCAFPYFGIQFAVANPTVRLIVVYVYVCMYVCTCSNLFNYLVIYRPAKNWKEVTWKAFSA
jgi:hypothetical protein